MILLFVAVVSTLACSCFTDARIDWTRVIGNHSQLLFLSKNNNCERFPIIHVLMIQIIRLTEKMRNTDWNYNTACLNFKFVFLLCRLQ